jgi:hypothetical protein
MHTIVNIFFAGCSFWIASVSSLMREQDDYFYAKAASIHRAHWFYKRISIE